MQFDRNGLTDVSATELASLELKEIETGPIWIRFRSAAGKKYQAGHWLRNESHSAIRLMGEDKDKDDFERVARIMADPMMVSPTRDTISDRGHDICQDLPFVNLPNWRYFNQWVAERVEAFYAQVFTDVAIERVYVKVPLNLTLKKDGTLIISSQRSLQEPASDNVLSVRTESQEMELGEGGNIVVRSNDTRWGKLMTLLLEGRFPHRHVCGEVVATL